MRYISNVISIHTNQVDAVDQTNVPLRAAMKASGKESLLLLEIQRAAMKGSGKESLLLMVIKMVALSSI